MFPNASASIAVNASATIAAPQPAPVIPPGYHIERVRKWGYGDAAQNRFVEEGYFSTSLRLVNGVEVGQFMIVNLIVYGMDPDDTAPRWSGTLDSITQFSTLTHGDVMKLANMQLIPFGYKYGMTDAEILAVKDVILSDGYTLHKKMDWMMGVKVEGEKVGTLMWGDDVWYRATSVKFGTMVNGGQLVAVSDETFTLRVRLRNMTGLQNVVCRKLLPFRRIHWGLSHADFPYLLQYATVANKGDKYGEDIRGKVMCPVALASEFDFAGNFNVTFYASPANWTVPV